APSGKRKLSCPISLNKATIGTDKKGGSTMKVLLALDSYKGSLSSWEAGNIAARAIQSVVPDVECEVIPMADGGEGTVDAVVKATNGSYETVRVRGPMGEIADAQIGLVRD